MTFFAPLAVGSPTDTLARMVGDELSCRLGQTIVIDNKAGGGSLIATQLVQNARPDGYTFLFAVSAHTINPAMRKNDKYDPIKDFTPIALIADVPHILVVGKDVPANNLKELIALAKASPGKMSYGSAGIGISNHMEGELFASSAGLELTHDSGFGPTASRVIVPAVTPAPILGIAFGPAPAGGVAIYYTVFAPRDQGGGVWRVPVPAECLGSSGGDAGTTNPPDSGPPLCGPGNCPTGCCTNTNICLDYAKGQQSNTACGSMGGKCIDCTMTATSACAPIGNVGGLCGG